MFCFTFVSDLDTDSLMFYSVQLKNMYSCLNSSLKLSDSVGGLSCQQSYCNLLSLYKLIIIIPFISSNIFLLFPSTSCLHCSLIPSDANDPQGLMRRYAPNKQTELFLLVPSANIAQMVPRCLTKEPQEL